MQETSAVLLNQRKIFSGRTFDVYSEHIKLPNGQKTTLDVVRHFASVVLAPMPDSKHIVLVRQYRYALDRWIWELPAGHVELGEDPVDAARRECEEETGNLAGQIERIGSFFPIPGYCDEEMIYFRLTDLTPINGRPPDKDEVLEPHLIELSKAKQLLADGNIVDMKTALGLTLLL